MRRHLRYLLWLLLGYLRTNEDLIFEHRRRTGRWPGQDLKRQEQE